MAAPFVVCTRSFISGNYLGAAVGSPELRGENCLLWVVSGSAGAGRAARTELSWSRLYSLHRDQQNNSLSDSFLRLQAGPEAAVGC